MAAAVEAYLADDRAAIEGALGALATGLCDDPEIVHFRAQLVQRVQRRVR